LYNYLSGALVLLNVGFGAFIAAAPPDHPMPWWIVATLAALNAVGHSLPNEGVKVNPAVVKAGVVAFALFASATVLSGCAQISAWWGTNGSGAFQTACNGLTTADAAFQAASPALIASGKLTAAQVSQEKAIYAVASNQCLHPPADPQTAAVDIVADAAAIYLLIAPSITAPQMAPALRAIH